MVAKRRIASVLRGGAGAALLVVGVGCGAGGGTVVVGPSGAAPLVQDNFFATWEIDSSRVGPLDCIAAGAATVDMNIVNVDSGARFVHAFDCNAYQGISGPVDVGRFDVQVSLADPGGGILSQLDVGTENVSAAGTIDLGHVIFTSP